jgi:hypothetical protein
LIDYEKYIPPKRLGWAVLLVEPVAGAVFVLILPNKLPDEPPAVLLKALI